MDVLGTDFDTLLTRGALALLALAAVWSLAVLVAAALEVRTRGRVRLVRHTGCPPAARLWLLAVFTAAFAGIAPAQASDQGTGPAAGPGQDLTQVGPPGSLRDTTAALDLDGLPLPDRPDDRRVQHPHPAAHPTAHPTGRSALGTEVVVVRGDSLWRIAQQRLPRHADDTEIAAAVAALYAANRPAIGPDPDLIDPGQHLVFPAPPIHPEEP